MKLGEVHLLGRRRQVPIMDRSNSIVQEVLVGRFSLIVEIVLMNGRLYSRQRGHVLLQRSLRNQK